MVIVRHCHDTAAQQRLSRGNVPLPEEGDGDYAEHFTAAQPVPELVPMQHDQKCPLERVRRSRPGDQPTLLMRR